MKLGVFLTLFRSYTLEEAFAIVSERGIKTVEIATGGYVGNHHLKPAEVLGNQEKIEEVKSLLKKHSCIKAK
jgi:sugar phosphate isomerase/epimerase